KERVPEYMVPASWGFLDELPRTPNGKIDRGALPLIGTQRPNLEPQIAWPRNEIEQALVSIWSQVLKIDQIGVHDNFFDLGGDSILGIQIISKANQSGLRLTPRHIFQYQTIAELAAADGAAAGMVAEQGEVTGPVRLTPIHHWFFDQNLAQPHHFNQSNLFEIEGQLDTALMEKAVAHLLDHHDALRLRCVPTTTGSQLVIAGKGGKTPFSLTDLSSMSESEWRTAIETKAAELQASLNLVDGPLMRVALFKMAEAKPSRLLMIIHHLSVDIVSWQILLRTLLTAYYQLSQGKSVKLPAKTTSFKQWADRLWEYAQAAELKREFGYWSNEVRQRVRRIPVDYGGGKNSEASARRLTVSISPEETAELLHELPKISRTQIQEALLTAVALGFERWTGNRSLLVAVEGHGREGIFEDADLSRTVGWFTAIYPALISLENADGTRDALNQVKQQLRSIPNGGIGYGLLRYLTEDAEVAKTMRNIAEAEVSFNYVGQFDRFLPGRVLKLAEESSGPFHSPLANRPFLIDISAVVAGGVLTIEFLYSENVHSPSTIDAVAGYCLEALQSLIRLCISDESATYKPSDFSLAKLDERGLSALADLISKAGRE
ncbi:MAG TPA: condensation domain-containing protein, partial [Blastocatellia bacterium]|nr:condensation domain-containing protein [Blastocatellia bacterium]